MKVRLRDVDVSEIKCLPGVWVYYCGGFRTVKVLFKNSCC